MRILILGGDGMLGHRLFLHLRDRHEVRVTLRGEVADYARFGLFSPREAVGGLDLRTTEALEAVGAACRPEAIVNCVGIVKQRGDASAAIPSLEINSLLPHRLAQVAGRIGARLVHFSTDCVFSGRAGGYREDDFPDAGDLYGRTKLLGEVAEPHCLTLRTSIIGHELSRKTGLLEWFLAQAGPVRGFRKAVFSGFTTIEMSRIVERMLVEHPSASGLWHVSAEPIDKHALLCLVRDRLGLPVEIVPDDSLVIDRSLDSTRFRAAFGYRPPSWDAMVTELRDLQR
jgi:dTDP-4-dehydrorhamnose reductase